MHALEVIIERNARAAGREAAHAANDGDSTLHIAIDAADLREFDTNWRSGDVAKCRQALKCADIYFAAFYAGRQDG